MDITALQEAIIFNAREIAQEIDDCEYVQKDGVSKHTKEQAKLTTYDDIVELIVGRGE